MFDNIGSKIKSLAQVVCWIGIVASVIGGFSIIVSNDEAVVVGLLTMVLGAVGSWVGSFVLYGFGQLIENSDTLVEISKHNLLKATKGTADKKVDTASDTDDTDSEPEEKSVNCPHCERKIIVPEGTITGHCPWCNKKISFM